MPSSASRKKKRRVDTDIELQNKTDVEDNNSKEPVMDDGGDFSLTKFFNQIFSENKSYAHRLAAIEIMCDQLTNLPTDEVHAQAQMWIGYLMKSIDVCKSGSARELALCCHTLSQLLLLCVSSSELCRIISLNIVPKLLTSLLNVQPSEQDTALTAVVNVMKICVKYFGGSCLSFKNKVESYLVKVALADRECLDSLLLKTCLSALSYLPCCGGQGSSGSKHSEMWYNQLCRLLDVIDELTGYLYASCGTSNKGGSRNVTGGQPFPTVADDGVTGMRKAAHHLQVYLKAVQAMLSTTFTWKVQIPVKYLLSVVCNVTSVTPDSVVFKNKARPELQSVCQALPSLHDAALDLISTLASLCGSCLYPYTTTISELLNSQLQWTKVMYSQSAEEIYIMSRTKVLDVTCSLISEPGLSSMLGGVSSALVEHALYDLSVTPATTQVESTQLTLPAVKRARKHLKSTTSSLTSTVSTAADRSRKLSALALIRQLLHYVSTSLTSRQIKMVYDNLVALVLSVQNASAADCYAKDGRLRHSLYQCLMASIHSYNSEVGPLTHIACQLIRNGLLDRCPDVRSLCNQALLICQLAVEPRAPPLSQHSSAFIAEPEQMSSADNSSQMFAEPNDVVQFLVTADAAVEQLPEVDDIVEPVVVQQVVGSDDSIDKEVADSPVESPVHATEVNDMEVDVDERNEDPVEGEALITEDSVVAAECTPVETADSSADGLSIAANPATVYETTPTTTVVSTTSVQTAATEQLEEEEPREEILDMMSTFVCDGPDE